MAKIPAYSSYEKGLVKNSDLEELIKIHQLEEKNGIVELTKENALKIEKNIEDDPSYIDYGFITFNYLLDKNKKFTREDYLKILRAIDIVNSTNVWRYDRKSNHKKMNDIVDLISNPSTCFEERVQSGDIQIVEDIRMISGGSKDLNDGLHCFASKVCKYFDEYINSHVQDYQNHYYIDDYYIRRMLPYYLGHYGIKQVRVNSTGNVYKVTQSTTLISKLSYSDLYEILEELRVRSECNLTRREIDHIIWYCYKSYEK